MYYNIFDDYSSSKEPSKANTAVFPKTQKVKILLKKLLRTKFLRCFIPT